MVLPDLRLLDDLLRYSGCSYWGRAARPAAPMPAPARPAAPRPTAPAPAPTRPAAPGGPAVLALLGAPAPPALAAPRPATHPALAAPRPAPAPASAAAPRPAPPPAPSPAAAPPMALAPNPAAALLADLEIAGFSVFRRGDKLVVTRASELPETMRERIKALRDALLPLAPPWPEISVSPMSAAMAPPSAERRWVAQAPRPLDGIRNIVVNFETDGLDWTRGNKPVGVTVGTLDGEFQQYLPFAHAGGNLDRETVIRFLRTELRGKHITNHNTRFDCHMGRMLGVDFEEQGNTVSDISHTAALLDDHRKRFALDALAADYLGGAKIPRVDESRMADYHAADVAARAEYQAVLVAQLHAKLSPMIDEQGLRAVHDLEDEVIYPVVEMEKNGAPIDMELLEAYSKEYQEWHEALLWEVSREVGFAFDHTPASWRRLFEHLNLPIAYLDSVDKSGKKKETFADTVISKIDHPIVAKARLAGQLASLNSKIMKPYRELVGPDGVLYFDLNQLRGEEGGTVSGRFSAGYIQQVPNADNHFATFGERLNPRRLFIPGAGMQYLAADAAQIEFRIFASMANNPRVMAAYAADPRTNFHKLLWAIIKQFNDALLYTGMKGLNFATIYGAGLAKTAVMMGFISGEDFDELQGMPSWKARQDRRLAKALEVRAVYDQELPEVGPLLKKASHLAQSSCDKFCGRSAISLKLHREFPHRGYVKTMLGRRARFPNNYGLHKSLNRVIQGTAADIMKRKLVELHKARKQTGFVMRMTVHDEVCGDSPGPETERAVMEVLNQQTTEGLRVPILWSGVSGRTWADAK